MARKNIFQLVNERYDIQYEIEKIAYLFENANYFYQVNQLESNDATLKDIIASYLFPGWALKGTCLSPKEFFSRANAIIPTDEPATEEEILNYLEVMENFIKLFQDNRNMICLNYGFEVNDEAFTSVFCYLIKTLEKRMGLTVRQCKDRMILYPLNAALEKVVDLYDDEDVQWELIRYERENLTLAEKKKSLAYLATNLDIEKHKQETNTQILHHLDIACNILNNLHIRHNNRTGGQKNEPPEMFDENEEISLCDLAYNEMLIITLLRNSKSNYETYKMFHKRQKKA